VVLEGHQIQARPLREPREGDRRLRLRVLRAKEGAEDEIVSVVSHDHTPNIDYAITSNF